MNPMSLTQQSIATGAVDETTEQIQEWAGADLMIQTTGGTLTTTGAEQTLVLVTEPLGLWCPAVLILDLDNMGALNTIIVKIYHRMADAGALRLFKYYSWTGADGGLTNGEKLAQIELYPNRHGYQITIQQSDQEDHFTIPWEFYAGV